MPEKQTNKQQQTEPTDADSLFEKVNRSEIARQTIVGGGTDKQAAQASGLSETTIRGLRAELRKAGKDFLPNQPRASSGAASELEALLEQENTTEIKDADAFFDRMKELSSHSKLELVKKILKGEQPKLAANPTPDDEFERERKRIELRQAAARASIQEQMSDALLEERILSMQQRRQPKNPDSSSKLDAEKEKRHDLELKLITEQMGNKMDLMRQEIVSSGGKGLDVERLGRELGALKEASKLIGGGKDITAMDVMGGLMDKITPSILQPAGQALAKHIEKEGLSLGQKPGGLSLAQFRMIEQARQNLPSNLEAISKRQALIEDAELKPMGAD